MKFDKYLDLLIILMGIGLTGISFEGKLKTKNRIEVIGRGISNILVARFTNLRPLKVKT